MTIGTGAALEAINRGIAITLGASDQGPIDAGVTAEAGVLVNSADCITGMAGDAESGVGDRCRVVMSMSPSASGEIVGAVAHDTVGIRGNRVDPWSVAGKLEHWWRGGTNMTIAAFIFMNRHWVVRRMTADTERGVQDMA